MTDQELFKQAFDGLRASADTYEEVLMKANGGYEPRHGITRRTFALALVGVLTCGGTAYAVSSGLFADAFGSKGHEDIPATALDDGKGDFVTAPAMQFVEASEEDVTRILGDAVQHVGLTCEAEGYLLTIDDLVVDGQGVGVATFTLTAPGGSGQFIGTYDDGYPDYGYLRYETDSSGKQLRSVTLRGANGEIYDHYEVVDLTQTTDDVLHGVMYFGALTGGDEGGLVFGLAGVSGQDGEADPDLWEAETDAFVPSAHVGSVELTDGQGHTAYVSPVSITYAAPFGEASGWPTDPDGTPVLDGAYAYEDQGLQDEEAGWVPCNTTIQLADGDPYVVEAEDVFNSYCSYYTSEGAMTLVFNRLVDPSQVTGVTADGPDGTTLEFVR
ncbi:MAG: hypothetical protein IJI16_05010 [Atopobiaceae bacterium]|nr:hypothetical protein [Atopobiaceae bacterium]